MAQITVSKQSAVDALTTTVGTKAPLDSPNFTGVPTAPTPVTTDNTTKLATTAFVVAYVAANGGGGSVGPDLTAIEALTPANNDFIQRKSGAWTNRTPAQVLVDLAHASSHAAAGSDPITISESQVTNLTTDLAAKAPLVSPTFTGTPAAPTPTAGDSTTKLATTAFVQAAVAGVAAGVTSWGNINGTLSNQTDLQNALNLKANLAGPTFTGTVSAPTPTAGDNTTKVATTAFVTAAVAAGGGGGGSGTETASVSQTAHGFTVGDAIYCSGTNTYAKAKADASSTAEVYGIVEAVADANTFTIRRFGLCTTLSTRTAGAEYYLSAATAGSLTTTAPSAAGQYVTLVYKAVNATSVIVSIAPAVLVSTASVTNAELANMAANTVKANITGSSAAPSDVSKASFVTWLGITGGGGSLTKASWAAREGVPPVTNGAVPDLRGTVPVYVFGDAATASVDFFGFMPEGYDGSNLTINLKATAQATTGDVRWEAVIERLTTDIDSESLGTVKDVTNTVNATSGNPNTVAFTMTQAEADGVTAGDMLRLRITRLGADAADTATGNAEIIGVEIRSAT